MSCAGGTFTGFPGTAVTVTAWIQLINTTSSSSTIFFCYSTPSTVYDFCLGARFSRWLCCKLPGRMLGRSQMCPLPSALSCAFEHAGVIPSSRLFVGTTLGTAWSTSVAYIPADGAWHLVGTSYTPSSGAASLWVDGVQVYTATAWTGTLSSTGQS